MTFTSETIHTLGFIVLAGNANIRRSSKGPFHPLKASQDLPFPGLSFSLRHCPLTECNTWTRLSLKLLTDLLFKG